MNILFLTHNDITEKLSNAMVGMSNMVIRTNSVITTSTLDNLNEKLNGFDSGIGMIVSYNYLNIIGQDIIDYMDGRIINLHISLLPWNRGFDPNFWSFIDNTPKGITIHLVDSGIDTGDILLQKKMVMNDSETLSSSYKKLHEEMYKLCMDNWEDLSNFDMIPKPQVGSGTRHYKKDAKKIRDMFGESLWDIPINELRYKIKKMGVL